MRLTGLLSIVLFVLIVFFAAPAASYAQTANLPAAKAQSTDSNSVAILPNQPRLDRVQTAPALNDRPLLLAQPLLEYGGDLVLRESPKNDDLCYTMRTYVVAREDKTSDATHPVRHVTCTPASKFGFKSADVRVDPPADAKPAFK
jgi:hypothetical protein